MWKWNGCVLILVVAGCATGRNASEQAASKGTGDGVKNRIVMAGTSLKKSIQRWPRGPEFLSESLRFQNMPRQRTLIC